MPNAVCQSCGKVVHWRNQRGVRLADYRCRCGGTYKSLPYTQCWKCEHARIKEKGEYTYRERCGDVCRLVTDKR